MAAYLLDHPPARAQFRAARRANPSGVVAVHTAENAPDFVAFDGGAEAVARFISTRTDAAGSYHDLVDSDSCVNLVPYTAEAFHDGTGTNPHSYGLSIATRADVWPLAPQAWRDGAVDQAAQAASRYAHWLHANYGIVIPARRVSAAAARFRVPGFTTHAELDPTRRSDPGAGFPWSQFLNRYAQLTADLGNVQEDDDMTPQEFVNLLQTDPSTYQALAKVVRDVLAEGAIPGSDGTWAHSNRIVSDVVRGNSVGIASLLAREPGEVDVPTLALLLKDALGDAVVDELVERLTEA